MLADWASLYAEPRFIKENLRQDFSKLTRIPMLPDQPPAAYSIPNDPDTGIRLPGDLDQSESRTHISITTLVQQLDDGAQCVITFDQSHYRNNEFISKATPYKGGYLSDHR